MAGKSKIFKTLDQQIEILKNKGLIINDIDRAKEILFKENYFFISGYRHFFTKNFGDSNFIEGTTFEELYTMFCFDRTIRTIFFKNILIVENNIKSILSYQLSKNYGYKEKDYLNVDNFNNDALKVRQVKDVLNKMKRQIRLNANRHTATMHYINNYGYIPMWILVKVLSFGILSELYGILKTTDQIEIASLYNLDVDTLITYLSILANYRNLCAHEDMLYDHRTQRMIPDDAIHRRLGIEKIDDIYKYGKNDLFSLLIILKHMLDEDKFRDLYGELNYEIDRLNGKINTLDVPTVLNKIGFPVNWDQIIE
ncbi:MAG: Abi family protein [Clostridium sp.]|nr:Abi family protein [Clostridium sp.]MCM1443845.1 Abi family protein [Candidatus Amulumruptor caecigallinarius]